VIDMPWIWLDENKYPEYQRNKFNILYDCENKETEEYNYCVADITKLYDFSQYNKLIDFVEFHVSADNSYILHINGNLIGIGPTSSGGDFLCRGVTPKHYADKYKLDFATDCSNRIFINAKVSLQPEMLTNYSRGHGGFLFEGTVTFTDGTKEDYRPQVSPEFDTFLMAKNGNSKIAINNNDTAEGFKLIGGWREYRL
jgi:hypothetical protein